MEHQTNSRPIAMKELARSAISWVLEPGIGRRGDGTSQAGKVYDAALCTIARFRKTLVLYERLSLG